MDDIPLTRHWVASPGSARSATTAFLGFAARRRRLWLVVGIFWLGFAAWLGITFDERSGIASRVVWGPVYALVPAACVYVLALALVHVQTSRSFRRRLRTGVELASGFGDDVVVLQGPTSQHRLAYEGIEWVRCRGEWVLFQQRATSSISVWPRELFDPVELDRLTTVGAAPGGSAEQRVEGDRDEQQ